MSDEDEDVREGTMIPIPDGDLVNIHEPEDEIQSFTLDQLNELGMPAPLATPDIMRAAYAYRRKLVASMLDREHDFLYTIAYVEQGKNREKMTTSYKEALKYSEAYKVPYKAVPKKSGIAKLATAFGVEETIVEQRGLPIDPNADYSYIKYEVLAKKSGKKAIGIGYADRNERGYPMPKHHMLALADTRAWGRAVLRLAGFGEAGAEEIGSDAVPMPMVRIDMAPTPRRLPAPSEAETMEVAMAAAASAPSQETRVPVATAAATPAQQAPAPAPAQQAPAPAPRVATVPVEVPMPVASTITEAQVGKLSKLLKEKLGSTERAKEWLMQHANVNTTRAVPESAYADLVKQLEVMEAP